ncbi:MAG: MFS transporter [Alphaproteobacteria bacterium]|nr:MFS transporter [Alphaproteobacteria bacterium]
MISCIAVYGLTAGMSSPLISLNLEARGVSQTVIGLNASMLAVAMLLCSPLLPGLIRRFGFRRVMAWSLLGEAGSFLCLPLSDNLPYWFAVRIVMGASATGLFLSGETWINQLATEAVRGRIIGIYSTMLALTFGLGPLLIPLTGIDGWWPFLTAALVVLAAGFPLLIAGRQPTGFENPSSFGIPAFVRQAPTLCLAVFLFSYVEMAVLPLLPVYGLHHGLATATAAAMLTALAAGNVCLQFPIGWAADHFRRRDVMLVCAVAGLLGAVGLPLVVARPWLLWPALFLWGGLFVGIYTVALAMVGERYRGGELVTANAAFGVLWGLGSLSGPIVAGLAMDLWPSHGLPAAVAVPIFAFLVVAFLRRGVTAGEAAAP